MPELVGERGEAIGSTDTRAQLGEHFANIAPEQQVNHWNACWEKSITPWDRNAPNPALIDALNGRPELFSASNGGGPESKRALVPGCGRGYDVLLFAAYGYDAYGLDASQRAVDNAMKLANEPDMPSKYPLREGLEGRGETSFLLADFFKDDFFAKTNGGKFDVIYDYTFLCALPPAMRPKWAKRMSELLSPSGHLICLEFPLAKPPSTGGPPHGLSSELYEQLFHAPGRDVKYDTDGYVVKTTSGEIAEGALKRIAHWRPERTHAVGQGKDMVSIWQHVRR